MLILKNAASISDLFKTFRVILEMSLKLSGELHLF